MTEYTASLTASDIQLIRYALGIARERSVSNRNASRSQMSRATEEDIIREYDSIERKLQATLVAGMNAQRVARGEAPVRMATNVRRRYR